MSLRVNANSLLPDHIKGSEVNRKGVMSLNAFSKLKRCGSVKRELAERLCSEYSLSFDCYFEEADTEKKKYAFETVNGYRKTVTA